MERGQWRAETPRPQHRDYYHYEAPTIEQLPKPPKAKALPAVKDNATAPEKAVLTQLMEQLGQASDLPDSVRALMAQIGQSTARTEGKALHKLVAQREEAYFSLEKVKASRASFEAGWAAYAEGLLELLKKQFTEREETLSKMDEAHALWTAKLGDASRALKAATSAEAGEMIEIEDSDAAEEMEAEVDRSAQETAWMSVRREQMTQQHRSLCDVLAQVRDSASAGAVQRDGSRTPRRRKTAADEEVAAKETKDESINKKADAANAKAGAGKQPGSSF
ncbi:hypothetical protein AK812_SmicGene8464 [Symbiodinium microadriaticum]|uniref:Uncharacterized protein n=1 Tax=Symbiodinium microadriaticum TaxID=2951 RepID=A0A1Q9EKZ5_SYMMI|nr:hypothetical protein AK812_SmicGene8464 [Symbiodinium microadriaticum]